MSAARWRPEEGRISNGYKPGTREPDASELAWAARFTVFLGNDGGNFDYWGDPVSGSVRYVGDPAGGCASGGYGDRGYWRSSRSWASSQRRGLTPEGISW